MVVERLRPLSRRGVWLTSCAVIAVASAGAAAAQTAAPAPSAPPASQPEGVQIGEVVVTAQRRSENLQSVPLSVVAISGADLRNQDINDVSRLEQVVPGLRLGRSGAAERPAIRGVYTEAIGINSDPRIGFYIDEVYQSRPQQTTASLVDLERVEVQKGPQGTLFGRNSYGGNIALTSATPKDKVEGGLDVTAGNYRRARVEGYFNAPLAPGLDARIAAEYERHDGYLESAVTSKADLQDKDEYYVRGSLKWTPPQLDGKLEVLVHASYYNRDDHGFNAVNGKVIGVAEDPSLIVAPGGTIHVNGAPFTFATGYNGLNVGTGTLYPYTNAFRDGVPDVTGADIGIPIPGKYKSVYDANPREQLEQQQYSGTVRYDLNPWLRLRSITAYTKFSSVTGGDGDGTPLPLLYYVAGTDAETFTQEFQVQSNHRGPLQYTVGGFYLYDKDEDGTNTYYLNRTYTTAASLGGAGPLYYSSSGGCQFRYATTAACNLNYASGNLYDYPLEDAARTQSYAAYAQASYTVFDKLTFTGGVRYTIDHKVYKSTVQNDYVSSYLKTQGASAATQANSYAVFPQYSDSFANLTCGGYTPLGYSTAGSNQAVGQVPDYFVTKCGSRTFEFATYRAAVDYKLTPQNLLYASFNTGRHSGGFGASAFAATAPGGSFTTFNSEGVEAWEIGSKNRFFDGRLQVNIDAFYNNYTHLQQQGTQFINNTNVTTIFNVGSEHAPGADLEIVAKPWRALTLNLAVNYLHARYSAFPAYVNPSYICYYAVTPACPGTSTTLPVNYGVGSGYFPNAYTAPGQFVATGLSGYNFAYVATDRRVQNQPDWSMQFGARYEVELPGGARLVPEFHTLFSDDYLLSPNAPNITQEAYLKTDVRVTWWSPDGRVSAQAFVQNLEDVPTLGRITVQGNGQIQGTYDDPRTFGVKVGYHF